MRRPTLRDSVVMRWMVAALGLVIALSLTQELARPETTDLISAGTAGSTLRRAIPILLAGPVSYTHLTLPTKRIV